jgi:uncharacterized protein YbjT (DUF2867 family)
VVTVILVVGATGQLGGLITRTLLGQGRDVRVLVRNDAAREALAADGAEPLIGDLKDPASLKSVCAGVDTVITTANSAQRGGDDTVDSVDRDGNRNLVETAAEAQVRCFVFVSALGAQLDSPVPFLKAKGESTQLVRNSGMTWTILEPNLYMDFWVPIVVGGPALAGQPVTLIGEGRRRHSMIAMRDVAEYAVAALDRREADGNTLVLGGPEPVSWRDVTAAFATELGRDVPIQTIRQGESIPGWPETLTGLLAAMDTYDSPIDMSQTAATYGVTPTSLAQFVHEFVSADR